MLLSDAEQGTIEASPARRLRAIEAGAGPRAPWLASAIAGLLALALLSVAAAPVAIEAQSWMKESLRVDGATPALAPAALLAPALVAAGAVLVATVAAAAFAQGGWVRIAAWKRPRRVTAAERVKGAVASWIVAMAALSAGVGGALPWLASVRDLAQRPLDGALWAVAAFVGSAALGALLAVLLLGFLQLRLAMRAFDRTLRMTHAEAREAARDDRAAGRRLPVARAPWRLA